jgi:hypothetical protein
LKITGCAKTGSNGAPEFRFLALSRFDVSQIQARIGERIRKLLFLVDPTSAEAQWFTKPRKQVILQP